MAKAGGQKLDKGKFATQEAVEEEGALTLRGGGRRNRGGKQGKNIVRGETRENLVYSLERGLLGVLGKES